MSICYTLQNLCKTYGVFIHISGQLLYNADMAINTPLPANIRVYKNGALFDKDKGRIVGMDKDLAEKNTLITKDNTAEFLSKRLTLKRNIIAEAANNAVERGDMRNKYGDEAWLAAIAENAMIKATTPDDPKSIDAARFLLQETGLSDKQAQSEPPAQVVHTLDPAVMALLQQIANAQHTDTYTIPIEGITTEV